MTDRSAFDEFVHARSGALARTAYLLTGNHHTAEDLVQHALLQTARHWERIATSPEAYARRIMYHQNISWWRKRRFTETTLGAYDDAIPAADNDLRLSLEAALARLTTKQRTILVLRFFEDLTEVQTAHAVGVSVGTVKSTTRHALARLRTLAPDLADLVGVDS
ncbi:SigE family RNA polymerase sigma factor [Nocardioides piscis]|uniref:SigE family RNA polymerase sigma factor n=1 Tax=Nocardioides piscis TaxID=2714938 RepID=A0A6G7YCY1_9ACTN|nr:SigE family RNA polymerase sigma factor [Nocardioides piscis]QIK74653.1 SigE family RNA polymerase sigma factor [Nocardioides piscis]